MFIEYSNKSDEVYIKGELQNEFDISPILQKRSCNSHKNLIRIDNQNQNLEDYEVLDIHNFDDQIYQVFVEQWTDKNKSITTRQYTDDNSTLLSNQTMKYFLYQTCTEYSIQNPKDAWDFIYVKVIFKDEKNNNHTFPFQFTYSCNQNYNFITFDWSLIILISISIILMALLTRFSRIMSFNLKGQSGRFQGFKIDTKITCFYFVLYCIGFFLFLNSNYVVTLGFVVKISTYVMGFSCSLFIIDETLCLSPDGSIWKRKIFYKIRVCEVLSFMLASAFMTLYLFTSAWYLSDLISIFIMSTIAKLFKFKNLKSAFIFLLLCILLDSTAASIIYFTTKQSYNSLTLKILNCPIELQLPLLELQYDRSCAWISLFSIAIPGLYMGFTYRFDKNKRTFSYTVFTGMSLLIGYIIWITTTIIQTYSIPSSVFIYPSILICTILVALKRNEIQSIWDAEFFDEFLEKTYRLSNIQGQQDAIHNINLLEGLDQCPDEQQTQSRILK
ncbi:unnamed protein product [Paramecium sonneborni]|uniref:Transmembrane protein n=1 Tax=Paramecium sonneborni TaxID=65129 RepID=A0A8S1Q4L0_9CILI|nr:unnamed protein product [Paramecium sonneborni]